MKKKFLPLIVCAVLLIGLTAAYFVIKNNNSQIVDEPEVKATEYIYIVSRERAKIESLKITNNEMDLTFVPTDDKRDNWTVKDNDKIILTNSPINNLSYSFGEFTAYSKVEADDINPVNYGFANPSATATATYTDGTSETLYIGNMTPDRQYAYIMREGDDSIYMIYEFTANRFLKNMNDIVDRTLPSINTNDICFFYVNQKGRRPIEIAFDGTEEELYEMYNAYGSISVMMYQPFYKRNVYVSNIELYITKNLESISLSGLVEADPKDYAKYGLEDPELEIMITSVTGDVLHLILGDMTDEGNVYCRLGGRYEVFTISYTHVQSFYDIDPFKFIDRFAALINIVNVENVTVVSEQASHTITMNHGLIKAANPDDADKEILTPIIDGILVEEAPFRKAYESIIAISYDSVIDDPVQVSGAPAVTITYKLNTGEPDVVIKLYEYNTDFYLVANEDGTAQFVTNKFSVRNMFEKIGSLINK